MTGYLGQVATRSARPDLSLRPRLASIFEPVGPSAAPPAWSGPVEETVEPVAVPDPSGAAPASHSAPVPPDGRARGRRAPEPGPPPAVPSSVGTRPEPPRPAGGERKGPARQRPAARRVGDDGGSAGALTDVAVAATATASPPTRTPHPRGIGDQPAAMPRPPARRDPARAEAEAEAAAAVVLPRPAVRPSVEPPIGPPPAASARMAWIGRLAPPTVRREARPAPEVNVRVTIGRVEVRATTPAPTPAPRHERAAPAPLSLDQYLRQRDRGDGR